MCVVRAEDDPFCSIQSFRCTKCFFIHVSVYFWTRQRGALCRRHDHHPAHVLSLA